MNICIFTVPGQNNSLEFIRICFHGIDSKPFSHNLGFTLKLFTDHAYVIMWDTDTVIVGIIIKITFRYKIKYIIKKIIKNQGAKYRCLRNAFKQFRPLTPCVSQLYMVPRHLQLVWSAPSQYPNQCWNIVNWTLGNKLQWNFNRNLYIFIQENAFENVVWKMAAISLGLNVLNRFHH